MKNYYQQQKGGFKLNPKVYAKIRKEIECYRFWEEKINQRESKSILNIPKKEFDNMILAKAKIDIIDKALINYVPEDYRKAVFEHTVDNAEYIDLEDKYHFTTPTIKRYVQRFTYGVAKLLGEDYTADEKEIYQWKG